MSHSLLDEACNLFPLRKSVNVLYGLCFVYTAISINVVGLKHEAKRQDRKLTWDFYE